MCGMSWYVGEMSAEREAREANSKYVSKLGNCDHVAEMPWTVNTEE